MGRPRKPENEGLPHRVYLRRGNYFYVTPVTGKWIKLGSDLQAIEIAMRELTAKPLDLSRITFEQRTLLVPFADQMYRTCRSRGLQRRIEFVLSRQTVLDLLIDSGGRCALTGLPFSTEKAGKRGLMPWMPSLDRMDATQGYISGNVRVVCIAVNIALSDFGDDVLLRIAHGLVDRQISSSALRNDETGANKNNHLRLVESAKTSAA